MRTHRIGIVTLSAAMLALTSASAMAQGKSGKHERAVREVRDDRRELREDRRELRDDRRDLDRDRDRLRDRDEDGRWENGRRVPPGLAKKPGQMPPGQYKKIYGANRNDPRYDPRYDARNNTEQGGMVLSRILRQNGYSVLRDGSQDQSRYVDYRLRDGSVRRAFVSRGAERLSFSNVPQGVLQQVLSKLY